MDKLFDSYWVLRVTALVLAILLFFYVKTEMDTSQSTTRTSNEVDIITNVELEVYYDDDNLIVSGLPKTVDVTIKGPMPIVLQTKLAKDFKVFVDLNSLLIGKHRVTIQTENFSDKLEVSIDPKTVDISIEEKVTEEFKIEPEMNSRLINEAFELSSMIANPTTVYVTGAKSVVESISYVKATVAGKTNIKSSFEQEANVRVLDSNLNKLDVIIEPATVKVNVEVYEYNRRIPIRIRQTGKASNGVTINRISTTEEAVQVYGPKSIIDSIREVVVEFDVSEITKSGVYKANVSLPNGATRLSSKQIEVQVDITKSPQETTTEAENVKPPKNEQETVEIEEPVETVENGETEQQPQPQPQPSDTVEDGKEENVNDKENIPIE